jgi:hypothetical protein
MALALLPTGRKRLLLGRLALRSRLDHGKGNTPPILVDR